MTIGNVRLSNWHKVVWTFLAAVATLAFSGLLLAEPALAQVANQTPPSVISPLSTEPDANNVNLTDGKIRIDLPALEIPADPRLRFDTVQNVMPYIVAKVSGGSGSYVESSVSVHYGGSSSEAFSCKFDDVCTNHKGHGSVLDGAIANGGPYSVTLGQSGAVINFDLLSYDSGSAQATRQLIYYASSVSFPDGETIYYTYQTANYPSGQGPTLYRITQMSSNAGYYISFTYQGSDVNFNEWKTVATAALYSSANPSSAISRLSYATNGLSTTITDLAGRTYICAGCDFRVGGQIELSSVDLTLPSEASATQSVASTSFNFAAPAMVTSVNRDGVLWSYAYTNFRMLPSPEGYGYDKIVVSGPASFSKTYNFSVGGGQRSNQITSIVDSLGRTTQYSYDVSFRPNKITFPEGNSVEIAYDMWGNIISKIARPKPGSGLAATTESAAIDASACSTTQVLCYRIVTSTDALNRQTNYAYDLAGRLIQQIDPADNTGLRRVKYLTYGSSFTSPVEVRLCYLGSTCGTPSEIKTQYTYLGNSPLPLTETVIDGVSNVSLTTTYTYDAAGRVLSVDGPLPGPNDATYYRYDVIGRKTWEIGPLGAGGSRPASRMTYRDSDNKVITTESGYVSDPNATALTVVTRSDTTYDSRRNPVRAIVSSGGTPQMVAEKSFDDRGLQICSTIRMNPATFNGAPTDACLLGAEGNAGPDRITRNVYDSAGQLLQVQKAVGTPLQENTATYTYSANGKQTSLADARGYLATMTYDGFDRQVQWNFPSPTTPNVASVTDYEAYAYDAGGNRTSFRKRDGSVLTYGYDSLNRLIVKNVPQRAGLPATHARSVFYSYDLRNLPLTARFDSPTGEGVSNAYDGLGRLTASSLSMDGITRTISYAYDAHGNRTQMAFPDGNTVTYTYDALNQPLAILRGTNTIASYSYDPANRRTAFNGGSATSYAYDGVGRLTALTNTPGGSAFANTYGFAYNPASQVTTLSKSNNVFAFSGAYNVNRSYFTNGLNQYTAAGSAVFAYDANGNLTGDGATSFLYDIENRLVAASGNKTANLRYDPLGRLYEIGGGSGTTRFLYDGDALVGEYDAAGNLLRRYVHGADAKADDPIAWYEGAGFTSAQERLLRPDWQGSIVLATDSTGANVLATNTYDEYGIPAATNQGRFQYTGQAWEPELGMYYYKARIYSPTLGRFLQTDPIGYKDQINLYAYVGNDPVVGTDSTGLFEQKVYTQVTGSNIKASVTVDAATKLTNVQSTALSSAFGRFIATHNGQNISGFAKSITGSGDKTIASVSSQFVGAAIASSGDKTLQAGWSKLDSIWLGRDPNGGEPAWGDGISKMGIDPSSRWFQAGPSNIARMMLHETYHLGFGDRWGGHNLMFFYGQHSELDNLAKRQLKASGLDGGGCLWNFPFSGC